jgi:hypothetical protein
MDLLGCSWIYGRRRRLDLLLGCNSFSARAIGQTHRRFLEGGMQWGWR